MTRLYNRLLWLAERDARHLVDMLPQTPDRHFWLADRLAEEGTLVLVGEVPTNYRPADTDELIVRWLETHAALYWELANALFPNMTRHNYQFLDKENYVSGAIYSETRVLTEVYGQILVPYLAHFSGQPVDSVRMHGVVYALLEALAAEEHFVRLAPPVERYLIALLSQPVRQLMLTGTACKLFPQDNGANAVEEDTAPQPTMTQDRPPVDSLMPPRREDSTQPVPRVPEEAQVKRDNVPRADGMVHRDAEHRTWRWPVPRPRRK